MPRFFALILFLTLGLAAAPAAAPEVIEGQSWPGGVRFEGRENLVLRRCRASNPDGTYGIELVNCRNIRIEDCEVRRIGREEALDRAVKLSGGHEFAPMGHAGIRVDRCHNVAIVRTEITDSVGKGIYVTARHWSETSGIVIEGCRIAYIYDDGILFACAGDQGSPQDTLPLQGGIIRGNVIHDIGLGLARLPFARHGMYLKTRDVLVEDNTIYNCFYGEGVSLRNAGIVRRNRIRNCARACLSYWAQTNTEGSSGVARFEDNDCRQDFSLPVPMRHIQSPEKLHDLPMGVIVIQLRDQPGARLQRVVVRGNRFLIGNDYVGDAPLVAGYGGSSDHPLEIQIEGNRLIDRRSQPKFFAGFPESLRIGANELLTAVP